MKNLLVLLFALIGAAGINAQISAELVQYPDVSENHICFTFGNDLWLVDKNGGDATKLSSPDGRETNPKC